MRSVVFMKLSRGPQQGSQIGRSDRGGPLQSGSFGKLIRERAHQPLVVCSGIGKPDPKVHRANTLVALYLALTR